MEMVEWYISKNIKTRSIIDLVFIMVFSLTLFTPIYASPYTVCTGKEFNQRVKSFLSGNDRAASIENTITSFMRGYNPPDDPAYYVDISEDRDGSVIVYTKENDINDQRKKNGGAADYNYTLYWYSDHIANMNPNTAFMFDKFVRIRNIDLSDFTYLKGLTDTRYMFLECRNLKSIIFKKSSSGKEFMPSEMQGMFFGCQSLSNVDLTLFDTKMVDNMDELFYKCYNLKNIYVDKTRWNVENVRSFTRMFSECHLLRSNDGKKAVDVPEDEYEKYAVPGDDKKEGFIKDTNYQYDDYGEYLGTVPIDGAGYLMAEPETTQAYAEEPEYDSRSGSGAGNSITPYVGDSASGYNADKQIEQSAESIVAPTLDSGVQNNVVETTTSQVESSIASTQVTIETTMAENETMVEQENVIVESSAISESVAESGGRRVMELDEFLKEKDGKEGSGEILGGILDNYKFLIFALAISAIVILLLVGMVAYLTKSNRENKDDESHKI